MFNNTVAGVAARSCQLKWLKQEGSNYCGARCHQEADNSNCSLLNELYKGKYFSVQAVTPQHYHTIAVLLSWGASSQKEMYLLGMSPQLFKCELQEKKKQTQTTQQQRMKNRTTLSAFWKGRLQEFTSSENLEYLYSGEKCCQHQAFTQAFFISC